MRVEKGMLVVADYLEALQTDSARALALAGILEAEQPPRLENVAVLRDWARIMTEEWKEAQENLEELEDADDVKDDDALDGVDEEAKEAEAATRQLQQPLTIHADVGVREEPEDAGDQELEPMPPLAGADPRDLQDPLRVAALVSVDVVMEEQALAERQLQVAKDEAQREQLQMTVLQLRAQHSTLVSFSRFVRHY